MGSLQKTKEPEPLLFPPPPTLFITITPTKIIPQREFAGKNMIPTKIAELHGHWLDKARKTKSVTHTAVHANVLKRR